MGRVATRIWAEIRFARGQDATVRLECRGPLVYTDEKTSGPNIRTALALLPALLIVASCGIGTGAVVKDAGPDDLLKLRSGPGLGYKIILGLPDGTHLTRNDCVTESGQLWCRVSLTAAPRITGYVSADYLATP